MSADILPFSGEVTLYSREEYVRNFKDDPSAYQLSPSAEFAHVCELTGSWIEVHKGGVCYTMEGSVEIYSSYEGCVRFLNREVEE